MTLTCSNTQHCMEDHQAFQLDLSSIVLLGMAMLTSFQPCTIHQEYMLGL
jgi:hypothetical protein